MGEVGDITRFMSSTSIGVCMRHTGMNVNVCSKCQSTPMLRCLPHQRGSANEICGCRRSDFGFCCGCDSGSDSGCCSCLSGCCCYRCGCGCDCGCCRSDYGCDGDYDHGCGCDCGCGGLSGHGGDCDHAWRRPSRWPAGGCLVVSLCVGIATIGGCEWRVEQWRA